MAGDNLSVADEKHAWHLQDVAFDAAKAVAFEDGRAEASQPDGGVQHFDGRHSPQIEGFVQMLIRIGDAWNIGEAISIGEFRDVGILLQMDEDDPDPRGFDLRAFLSEIGQQFPAERAAAVPQKCDEHWLL